jgi:hypothetical protein
MRRTRRILQPAAPTLAALLVLAQLLAPTGGARAEIGATPGIANPDLFGKSLQAAAAPWMRSVPGS